MCEPKPPVFTALVAPDLPPEPPPSTGSRRKRLWEVPRTAHCPVVGVCLPLDTLRRVVNKALGGETVADDYDLHVGVVTECGLRNRVSEAVQRELERRCAHAVRHFSRAKTGEAMMSLWDTAIQAGDVAAPLWAALTHPRCTQELHDRICRDIHMIQHQAGATVRADVRQLAEVTRENRELSREIGEARARVAQAQSERALDHDRLAAQLMQARAAAIGKDTTIEALRNENASLRESMPELQSRLHLSQRVSDLTARNRTLDAEVDELRRQLAAAEREVDEARARAEAAVAAARASADDTAAVPVQLAERSILCVGGRHAQIPIYRDLVERHGGRFSHHDGGIEDNAHRLDASLAAADLVICQTGCLSHNAYWLVKDHCKRTGKRCVYLDQPSVASFTRSLAALPVEDTSTS